jgi:TolB-like protein/DNA-binding winged helix-turn-helix (wHTH) protein/Tfp pilus assembly protein PilF
MRDGSRSNIVCFGPFRVDLPAGELHDASRRIRLQEQPFQVLKMLIERPGELLTRDEIRHHLWPNGTVVEFDQSINAAVKKLRMALGDSAEEPRYVETVGRRGYRFIAQVNGPVLQPSAVQVITLPQEPVSQATSESVWRHRSFLYAVSLFVTFIVMGLLGWRALRHWNYASRLEASRPAIRSLAVLPFENLSPDPNQNYFTEGITDELITNLAKLSDVRVISRTSVMQYSGTRKSLPQIAQELQVDGIVEGTLTRDDKHVRIRVQLVDARRDEHLWAEAYERSLKNLLQLEAEIAEDVASEIKLKLTAQQRARLSTTHSVTPEVHELYLRGRYFWNKRDELGLNKAVRYFQEAIAKDPNYAEAYSGLADSYVLLFSYAAAPPPLALQNAKAAAEKALQLDDTLAEGHTSLALIALYVSWNWEESRRHYERALELKPNYATAHHWYGDGYLGLTGRLNEAIAEIQKALELDPLSPIIATDLGKNLILSRKYDEAIVQLKKALELDPNFGLAHYWLWYAYTESGKYSDAKLELEKTKRYREARLHLADSAYLQAKLGNTRKAHQMLSQLLKISRREYVNPAFMAYIYIALGDTDQALAWLEKGYDEKLPFIGSLKVIPTLDPLRSDPRFINLMHRVGLPN